MDTKELKHKYKDKSLEQLIKSYDRLQAKHDKLKSEAAEVWHEFDWLRRFMVEAMDDIGALTMKIKDGRRLEQRHQMSVKQKDSAALAEWLTKHKHEDLIKSSINSSALSSFIRHQMAEGDEIPDDSVIQIDAYDYVTIVKG